MGLTQTLYNNTLQEWLWAVIIVGILLTTLILIKRLLYRQISTFASKTKTEWDDLAAALIQRMHWGFFVCIAVYIGSLAVALPPSTETLIQKLVIVVLLIQGAILGSYGLDFWTKQYKRQKMETNAAAVTTVISMGFVLRVILWSLIVLLALDNLGVNITTLVAGLGITGIAVALAIQNILGDLFASLSIVLDKPFVIGDFVIIDTFLGTIEHIGLKTTRIRSLSGEQLIFSNSDMLQSRIRNFKRMYERRVVFSISVVYNTPHEKLAAIPEMLKNIVSSKEHVRFDRAHFKEYGAYALNFEIVYWINNPDYTLYMDIQQAINLEIYRTFEQHGLEFAYPTQTLYLQRAHADVPDTRQNTEHESERNLSQSPLPQESLHIQIKSVHEPAEMHDGERILVNHFWPPGVKKAQAHIALWLKELAPSPALRKWFGHNPARWTEFKNRYFQELQEKPDAVHHVLEIASQKTVTLVFGARDNPLNIALALKEYLETHALTGG